MTELEISYAILDRIGIDPNKIKASGWTTVHCPLHEDKNPSCGVRINEDGSGVYNCFSCGSHGTLRQLYREINGVSINRDLGIPWDKQEESEASTLVRLFKKDTQHYEEEIKDPVVNIGMKGVLVPVENSPIAKQYLAKRKISLDVAKSMKMKYAIEAYTYDKLDPSNKEQRMNFSNRLIIPIFENGKILSYEGRDVAGKKAWETKQIREGTSFLYKKCIYPKGASTNTLYQLDKLNKDEHIYFLEGLMDLAILREDKYFNESNSTTIFGASITNRQLQLLSEFKSFTYIIDNDLAGWRSLKRLKDKLKEENKEGDFRFITPPFENMGVKDVGDIPVKAGKSVEQCRHMKWLDNEKSIMQYDDFIDQRVKVLESIKLSERKIISE